MCLIGHSSSKTPDFQNQARCTTFLVKISFICMRMKQFPYQRLSTYPRFETEAQGNSEINGLLAYFKK